MPLNGRILSFLFTALLLPLSAAAALPFGVAAGDATTHSVMLWAQSTAVGRLRFDLSRSADFRSRRSLRIETNDPSVPVKVLVDGLAGGVRYHYRAVDAEGATARGTFRTLPAEDRQRGLHFGVSGDIQGELAPFPALRNAAGAGLDFFVCLGDCIYAENYGVEPAIVAGSMEEFRAKYRMMLSARHGLNTVRALRQATVTYAMIDDHEVIDNFSGGAPPASDPRFDRHGAYINETDRYRNGLRAFLDYMPLAEEAYGETGDARDAFKPKLYRARTFGKDALIVLLDARSFRDAPLSPVENLSDTVQTEAYLAAAFTAGRTLLGKAQLRELEADLQAAEDAGVVWKFVMVPEPIQNLGLISASDRYEGYAAERTELLRFIQARGIRNVVLVSADIHGTLINNLSYEEGPAAPKVTVDAFEITTGPVAYHQPFGPTVVNAAMAYGLLTPLQETLYAALPVASDRGSAVDDKDDFVRLMVNTYLSSLGYDPIGLEGSPIPARLLRGDWLATHVYGWTRFDVDGRSKKLRVTTYGVSAYGFDEPNRHPRRVRGLKPAVVSRFEVRPR